MQKGVFYNPICLPLKIQRLSIRFYYEFLLRLLCWSSVSSKVVVLASNFYVWESFLDSRIDYWSISSDKEDLWRDAAEALQSLFMENNFLVFYNVFSSENPHIGLLERIYQKINCSFLLKEIRTHSLVFPLSMLSNADQRGHVSLSFCLYFLSFLPFFSFVFYCSKQSFILIILLFFIVLRRISASYLFPFLFLFSLFFWRIEDDTRCTNGEKRTPTDDSSLPITKDFIVDKRTCIRRTIA